MRVFDEFTRVHMLSNEEMRNVKAGEEYHYKITCPDGKTYSGSIEIKDENFGGLVEVVCGKNAKGSKAIFC